LTASQPNCVHILVKKSIASGPNLAACNNIASIDPNDLLRVAQTVDAKISPLDGILLELNSVHITLSKLFSQVLFSRI
jgi:hypothetical protein